MGIGDAKDVVSHQQAFNEWLAKALPNTCPDNVGAYNFNIAETKDAFVVELIGASAFDPQNSDWACHETWTCRPSQFVLPHADIGTDWKPAEAYVVGLVREFLQGGPPSKARLLRESSAVAVGFVDGDLVYIWPQSILPN